MKVLLHICCAPDATTAYRRLSEEHDVTGYFFNPNVHPIGEYEMRASAVETLSREWNFDVLFPEYDPEPWFGIVKGLEDLPEGSERCRACIAFRLKKTAEFAKEMKFGAFATSLTTSPHKDVTFINDTGKRIGAALGIEYVESAFRKKNGFLESLAHTKDLGLYRQNYCGCVFSDRKAAKV